MRNFIIVAFVLISIGTLAQNQVPYGNNPAAGHYAQTSDAKLYYELYGNPKGKPIILLHGGIAGSIGEMRSFIERLSKDYQIIAMATRGHGKSELGNVPISYEQKANDVIAVINAVTKDSVTVLGFSDGAYTGYIVASRYPGRVKKLIAIGAGEQIPGLRKVVFEVPTTGGRDSIMMKQRLALSPEPQRYPEFLKKMETFYNSMTASKELFNSIKCPVLLLSGERDLNALLPSVISAYQMIPNSQLCIIPKAGHVVFFTNFPAVWENVAPFLKE